MRPEGKFLDPEIPFGWQQIARGNEVEVGGDLGILRRSRGATARKTKKTERNGHQIVRGNLIKGNPSSAMKLTSQGRSEGRGRQTASIHLAVA